MLSYVCQIGVGLPSMSSIKKSVDPDDEEHDHPNTIVLARSTGSTQYQVNIMKGVVYILLDWCWSTEYEFYQEEC